MFPHFNFLNIQKTYRNRIKMKLFYGLKMWIKVAETSTWSDIMDTKRLNK